MQTSIQNIVLRAKLSKLAIGGLLALGLVSCSKNTAQPSSNPPSANTIATVNVDSAVNIAITSAVVNAHITKEGGNIKRKGICWSMTHNATVDSTHADSDPTISSGWIFASNLNGLQPNTVYYAKAYVENERGLAYSSEFSFTTQKSFSVYVDSSSFSTTSTFLAKWSYNYPWGTDHNGSARMYSNQVTLNRGVLSLQADRITTSEGKSSASPNLPIHYHSGTVYLNQKITVTDSLPTWIISGDFQSPSVSGTWPAFWITGVDNWPPETDIMEFKGDSTVWQNTMTGPNWQSVNYQTKKTLVSNASNSWHNYKIIMKRVSSTMLTITYFVDNKQTVVHTANFMNQRFWLIIDLQMEGSSGSSGPTTGSTIMRARNIYVAAQPK